MKPPKTLKSGYYVIREKGLAHCGVALYESRTECFFLCGDPFPRTVGEIAAIIARVNVNQVQLSTGKLFWFSLFCLVLSIVLTALHTPCE